MNTNEYFEATLLFEKDADPDEIISILDWLSIDNEAVYAISLSTELDKYLETHINNQK